MSVGSLECGMYEADGRGAEHDRARDTEGKAVPGEVLLDGRGPGCWTGQWKAGRQPDLGCGRLLGVRKEGEHE